MRKYTGAILCLLLLIGFSGIAQDKSNRPSPPAQVEASIDGLKIIVDYSRPSVKGREIFGNLEPYGKVWRTGANETTWIDFSEDVKINGKSVAKGRYGLYTIPNKDKWTIIINSTWKDWGAYKYDSSKDVARVEVAANNKAPFQEQFLIGIDDSGNVSLSWDSTSVSFKVEKD